MTKRIVQIENAVQNFDTKQGKFCALRDVNLAIHPGECISLIGHSGCGKSTLGNAILQLDKATAGQILYNGVDITKLSNSEIKNFGKTFKLFFKTHIHH